LIPLEGARWIRLQSLDIVQGGMYDSLGDRAAGSPTIGFTSGFNTFHRGRDPNPLEAVRRNWVSRPSSLEAIPARPARSSLSLLSPPATLPLSNPAAIPERPARSSLSLLSPRATLPLSDPVPNGAALPVRAASPPRSLAVDNGAVSEVPIGAALSARAPSPVRAAALAEASRAAEHLPQTMATLTPMSAPALSSRAPAPPVLAELVGHDQAAGHLRIVVPHPLEGSKLGLTVKQLVVATVADPRALEFGWALGDQILKVNGVPVSNTRELSAALTGALNAWKATGQAMVFDIWRPPATAAGGETGGVGFMGPPLPPGQDLLHPPPTATGAMPPGAWAGHPGLPPGTMPGASCPAGPLDPRQLQGQCMTPGTFHTPPYHAGLPPETMLGASYPAGLPEPHQLQGQCMPPGTFRTPPYPAGPAFIPGMPSTGQGPAFFPGMPSTGQGPNGAAAHAAHPGAHGHQHQGSARRNFSKRRAIC